VTCDTRTAYFGHGRDDEGIENFGSDNLRKETASRTWAYTVGDLNPLTPKDPHRGRTAPLTSKRCILYIYSTNIGTEYFKHDTYSPFFFLFKMQFVS